jgi:GT2 family glycosyltransferase
MLCDIIIPVWNQLEVTKDCINSIRRHTDTPYRLILVDNGSDAPAKDYLEGLKTSGGGSVVLIRNDANLGFVKAVNLGVGSSNAPYICVLNNDTIATKSWLGEMIKVAESSKDIGIVNPSSNNLGQRPPEGMAIEAYAEDLKTESGRFIELGAAIGFCMLIKREVIGKIGLFDEIYGMGNFEDTDFSRKAAMAGYRCVRARGAYVYHRENSSFNKLKSFEDDFKRNREIFEFRWGRPKRIAYIVDSASDNLMKMLLSESLKLARSGNWISYISKASFDVPPHSNITFLKLPEKRFYTKVLWRILKKKKRFDEIYVGDGIFGRFLTRLTFLHKAKVCYY